MKDLNRLKVVLAEQKKTGKWLTERLGKNCLHLIRIAPQLLMGWIHSKLFHFIYECYFEGLKMAGGYLPFSAPYLSCMCIPQNIESYINIIELIDEILTNKKSVNENMDIVDKQIYLLCNKN